MNDDLWKRIDARFRRLEQDHVKHRVGVVTDLSPLSVALGGSDTPYTDVKRVEGAALAVDDVVSVLKFDGDLIILGRIADTAGDRIVWGIVNSDGTLAEGTGFTPSRTGTGDYTLTWSEAFSDVPAVDVTANGGGDRSENAEPTTTTCRVTIDTSQTAGTLIDTKFNFIAVGPA